MKKLLFFWLITLPLVSLSQEKITLEGCYQDLEEYYPIAKQQQLFERQNQLELDAIATKSLPQISFNAQANYYSDITQVPLPNLDITPLNNDQYKATFTAQQLIFKGNEISVTKNLQNTLGSKRQQEVKVELHALKKRLNQLYFSVLLIEDQTALLKARKKQLNATLKEVRSGVNNGVLLPMSDRIISIELIKIKNNLNALAVARSKNSKGLSVLINRKLKDDTEFINPIVEQTIQPTLKRPELNLFTIQKDEISFRSELISKAKVPTLSGFTTVGYGNPALNMLKNAYDNFYIVGLQMNWNTFDWNFNKKKRAALEINKAVIQTKEEAFTTATRSELEEIQEQIDQLNHQLDSDQTLIDLQQDILSTVSSQLKNGLVTASVYMREFTNLFESKQALIQHQKELELAKANYNITQGIK